MPQGANNPPHTPQFPWRDDKSHLHEKYRLNALNISQDSRFGNFLFPILASIEIKNSEMCPWLLRGEGDPEHTCNKAKANLITMSFIQRWRGYNSCPLNINGGTQNQKAMIEGQRNGARSGLYRYWVFRTVKNWQDEFEFGGVIR